MSETGAPPRVFLIAAVVLATALAVTVAVLGITWGGEEPGTRRPAGPLALVSVPAPQADSPQCAELVAAAPETLKSAGRTLPRRELAEPAPPATLAWGEANPIVLRCGLPRPGELTRTSPLRVIDGVQWLQVPGDGSATWYAVDREVYAALTVPADAGTGPLQDISGTISATLPAVPLRFG
ncbi:Protein of unknown function (DUF3515) [Saccharomonospora marina XMU15]|uniref:DUF3515 domain-containing protein n=1 Tax=Saccharomonospora marina XMU15 TaxID=882083 RepID=H5WYI2_9PSEU|nr:DUF3515 domain-containing protein [Saccharomonospora marina]EHR49573.1 Protein of unknown function (DUF3515) [Saccharomonospora marina XMU15]